MEPYLEKNLNVAETDTLCLTRNDSVPLSSAETDTLKLKNSQVLLQTSEEHLK